MAKIFFKSPKECVGKVIYSNSMTWKTRGLFVYELYLSRILIVGYAVTSTETRNRMRWHIDFIPGKYWTEVPDYIEKWSEKL